LNDQARALRFRRNPRGLSAELGRGFRSSWNGSGLYINCRDAMMDRARLCSSA
jgi:hypothetical protein